MLSIFFYPDYCLFSMFPAFDIDNAIVGITGISSILGVRDSKGHLRERKNTHYKSGRLILDRYRKQDCKKSFCFTISVSFQIYINEQEKRTDTGLYLLKGVYSTPIKIS